MLQVMLVCMHGAGWRRAAHTLCRIHDRKTSPRPQAALHGRGMLYACTHSNTMLLRTARRSAESFRAAGLPAIAAHQAGHQPPKLLHAGYSTADIIACGASLAQLRVAEVSVKDLVSAPATAARLAGWQGAQRLLLAGYSPAQLASSGAYDIYELAKAGAPEEQLRSAGCDPNAVRQAGLGPPHAQPLQPSAAGIRPVMQVTAGQLHKMWPGWGPGGPPVKAGTQAQGRPRSGSSASGTAAGRSRPGSAVMRHDGSSSQVDVGAEGSVGAAAGRPHSAALVRVMREALGSAGGSNAGGSGGSAMHTSTHSTGS